tara:strand:+ start:352 stop:579 length:228 start_codon:yes stop_codon:yes gene_type:complete
VLALAIEKNVRKGLPIDELSGRKSDYIIKKKEEVNKFGGGGEKEGVAKRFWFDEKQKGVYNPKDKKKKKSKHRRS